MTKQQERPRVAREVLGVLRSQILDGTYKPGTKLPSERDLARSLGVNRASLREALKKLEHLGLVTIRQGDGTRVTNFMETAGIELITHLVPSAAAEFPTLIPDMLEFRRVFGREMARLAAERADTEAIQKLAALAARAEDPELSDEQLFELDFELYVALASASKNRVMVLLINTVRDAAQSYGPLLAGLIVNADRMREHQRELIAALRERNADRAAATADAYLKQGAERVLSFM